MDVFDEELLKFWRALQQNNVQYIMVGGVATNLHGYSRMTDDIDVWVKDSLENRKKLRKAFSDYGIGDFEPLERMPFVPGWTYFHLNNGLRLDIMVEMKGLEEYGFDECYNLTYKATIFDVEVPFLHINHLLTNKKAVNRLKDQLDVKELERIQKISGKNEENNS
jgi:hypothetical protein